MLNVTGGRSKDRPYNYPFDCRTVLLVQIL